MLDLGVHVLCCEWSARRLRDLLVLTFSAGSHITSIKLDTTCMHAWLYMPSSETLPMFSTKLSSVDPDEVAVEEADMSASSPEHSTPLIIRI